MSFPRIAIALSLSLSGTTALGAAQSDGSRQSEASLVASVEVPVAVSTALSEGAGFVISGLTASGTVVAVTVSAATAGASLVVYLSVDAIRRLAIGVGTAVSVTAVATAWLLSVAGESLCFIGNEEVHRHIHSHRIAG